MHKKCILYTPDYIIPEFVGKITDGVIVTDAVVVIVTGSSVAVSVGSIVTGSLVVISTGCSPGQIFGFLGKHPKKIKF